MPVRHGILLGVLRVRARTVVAELGRAHDPGAAVWTAHAGSGDLAGHLQDHVGHPSQLPATMNLPVLLLNDANKRLTVPSHHRHTCDATTFQNPYPQGLQAKTTKRNDVYRREYDRYVMMLPVFRSQLILLS